MFDFAALKGESGTHLVETTRGGKERGGPKSAAWVSLPSTPLFPAFLLLMQGPGPGGSEVVFYVDGHLAPY